MGLLVYALTTKARVKTFLGISSADDDTLLESLINVVTNFIENYCDRRFKKATYANEVYDGNGASKLLLKQYPVVSGQTFTLEERDSIDNQSSWSSIDSEEFFVLEAEGIIDYIYNIFTRAPQHYRVSYVAGYDFDPAGATTLESVGASDLEYACWKLVGRIYNQRKDSANVQSESLGDYSVSLRKEVLADVEISEILNKYKRPYEC